MDVAREPKGVELFCVLEVWCEIEFPDDFSEEVAFETYGLFPDRFEEEEEKVGFLVSLGPPRFSELDREEVWGTETFGDGGKERDRVGSEVKNFGEKFSALVFPFWIVSEPAEELERFTKTDLEFSEEVDVDAREELEGLELFFGSEEVVARDDDSFRSWAVSWEAC